MPRITMTAALALGLAVLGASGCAGGGGQAAVPGSPARDAQSVTLPPAVAHRILTPEDIGRVRGLIEPATHSWMSPAVKGGKPIVYVLEGTCACVYVYPVKGHNQEPIGQIAGLVGSGYGPDWIGMGNGGNLWISFGNGTISSYPRGATKPSTTLSDPGAFYPQNIAVDDAGTVYVSNTSTNGEQGNVVLYQNGATSPTQTLTDPSVTGVFGLAVDRNHNVFVSALNTLNQRFIGEFVAGPSNTYTFTQLVAGQNPSYLYLVMQLDSVGNVVVASQGPQSIDVYSPPNWNLTATLGGTAGPTGIAFTSDGTKLFAAYLNNRAVVEFAYPSGKQLNEIIAGLYTPQAVAVDPKPPLAP
jgi:hypothetical protein